MATALRQDGFLIRIFAPPREHPPAHVHVERGRDAVAVIALGTGSTPPVVWAVYGMRNRDVLKAYRLVQQHQAQLYELWRSLHGDTRGHD